MNETCDRCGPAVKATTVIRLPSGGKLTFCDHHARQYRKLVPAK